MSDESEVEVPIGLAGFGHLFDFLPCLALRFVFRAIFDSLPFFEEDCGLQVIEDRLSERVDGAENGEIALVVRGDDPVQDDPLTALAEIVFDLTTRDMTTPARVLREMYQGTRQFSKCRIARWDGETVGYFPMQKVLNIRVRMSSVVVAPVISSRGRRAL